MHRRNAPGLSAIAAHLESLPADALDALRGKLRIGIHRDVEVTIAPGPHRPLVSQAFCSALPLSYGKLPPADWKPFASLVLEAAYEATLLAAVLNKQRGGPNTVFLTLLGGGAFGNPQEWIIAAIRRAFNVMANFDLDVRLVSYSRPSSELMALADAVG